ncbi:hypothetical protein [Altericroceibacterium xinjiangense]|uniref:hypothetical protein n=1 Tax=Altericroceibacterium xinjiangense TaxID=762261 RepID=UPI000F7D646C|nr:hypothetical protein [Altericroceibacterium xinjiangense]
MTDHPSTYKAVDTNPHGIEWEDHAMLHLKGEADGLFNGMKTIGRGTLAEMVARVSRMPEGERERYVIEKAGDHELGTAEIMALAARDDFPGKMGKSF